MNRTTEPIAYWTVTSPRSGQSYTFSDEAAARRWADRIAADAPRLDTHKMEVWA